MLDESRGVSACLRCTLLAAQGDLRLSRPIDCRDNIAGGSYCPRASAGTNQGFACLPADAGQGVIGIAKQEQHLQPLDLLIAGSPILLHVLTLGTDALQNSILRVSCGRY